MKLDQEAALMSTSWGIAQVMGFNYKIAGFDSVNAPLSWTASRPSLTGLAIEDCMAKLGAMRST